MKAHCEYYPCFFSQALKAARMVTSDICVDRWIIILNALFF